MGSSETNQQALSPKLGWLEAFLCTANRSFVEAGRDLDLHPVNVQKRVEKLERWLRKPLVHDGGRQLCEDGEKFVFVALDILGTLEGHRAKPAHTLPRHSSLTLADFENFVTVAEAGSYEGASIASNRNVTTIGNSVKALEGVLGNSLISGPAGRTLTQEGDQFREAAQRIVDAYNNFRAVLPDNYDPTRGAIERLFKLSNLNRIRLAAAVHLIERTGKKRRGKVRLAEVREKLKIATSLHEYLIEQFGPFGTVSGKDVDLSDWAKEREAVTQEREAQD